MSYNVLIFLISKFDLLKIHTSVQNKNNQNYIKLNNMYTKLKNHIFLHLYHTHKINLRFRATQ